MNFPDGLFPETWQWVAWLFLLPAVAWLICKSPWKRLAAPGRSNVWFGAIVALSLLWTMKAGVRPGLNLHLLGATALVLMFGFRLAVLAMLVVLAVTTANGAGDWQAFGLNAWVLALLPVAVAHGWLHLVERRLPGHLFVFIFLGAFANAALTLGATAIAATLLLSAGTAYDTQTLFGEYLPYFLMMCFPEAWLTGAFITLFVVYLPEWVVSFDDSRYLAKH